MSTAQLTSMESSNTEDRRLNARRRLDRLAYIHLDRDNGGILINVSEGGVNFQGVAGLMENEPCSLTFTLPGLNHRFEVRGEVAWANDSRKGGGLRFVDLSDDARLLIKDWLLASPEQHAPERPVFTEHLKISPQPVVENNSTSGEEPLAATQAPDSTLSTSALASDVHSAVLLDPAKNPGADSHPLPAEVAPKDQPESGHRSAGERPPFPSSDRGVRRERVRIPSSRRSSRVNEGFIVVADLCLLALGVVIAISRFPGPIATVLGTTHAAITDRAPATAGDGGQRFQVAVSDISGRRWVLSNDGDGSRPAVDSGAEKNAAANHVAVANHAPSDTGSVQAKPLPASRSAALGLPFLRQQSQSNLDAPVLTDGSNGAPSFLASPVGVASAPEPPVAPPSAAAVPAASAPAVLIHRVDPQYPRDAALAHLSGAVRISFTIGKDGVPSSVKALSGDPRLAVAAADAVREWRYTPALLEGKPAESQLVVTLNFQLK